MKAYEIKQCRICGSENLYEFLDLGNLPIPNGFLEKEELKKPEKTYPLTVVYCRNCSLSQLKFIVNPEIMFRNYLYIPSVSLTRLKNFEVLLEDAQKRVRLQKNALIVDAGSNDGSLLNVFKNKGFSVMGVDPAENLVKVAELNGIPTILGYFTPDIARRVRKKEGSASVIFATNVFAHVGDLQEFLDAVAILLSEDGVFISQFPYVLDLLHENQFDTIYHEHLSYFSVKSLIELASRSKLEIVDIESSPLDGGSLKTYWKKRGSKKNTRQERTIQSYLSREEKAGLYQDEFYDDFAVRVNVLRKKTTAKLRELKRKGKRIVGYGAAAKGNILLNYFGLTNRTFDYIVDSTPYKQGKYTPGTHIPIFAESKIRETRPEFVVILAWNFAEEIMKKNADIFKYKGKFIIPIPEFKIVSK